MNASHTPNTSAESSAGSSADTRSGPRPGLLRRGLRRGLRTPIGVQSIIAVGLGALIGTLAPSAGEQMKILGGVFLNLVQVVVLPLVFPLIVLGIARMESVKKVGRIAYKAILYFELVTTVVLLIAVGLAKFTGIGKGAPVHGTDAKDLEGLNQGIDFHELVLHAVPKNIFAAFGEGNLLGAITFALLVGVAMASIGRRPNPSPPYWSRSPR